MSRHIEREYIAATKRRQKGSLIIGVICGLAVLLLVGSFFKSLFGVFIGYAVAWEFLTKRVEELNDVYFL